MRKMVKKGKGKEEEEMRRRKRSKRRRNERKLFGVDPRRICARLSSLRASRSRTTNTFKMGEKGGSRGWSSRNRALGGRESSRRVGLKGGNSKTTFQLGKGGEGLIDSG